MKHNVGSLDRIIRMIVGLVIIGIGYHYRSWWGLVGALPILTALVRFCPAYLPLGISTSCAACAEPEKKDTAATPPPSA
jgi:Protein of unknown function (DUF2892)